MSQSSVDLSVVTTAPDIVAATGIKTMLEQAGIPAMLRGAGSTNWLVPGTPGGVGPLDVLVPADRLAEAQELLAALEAGDAEGDEAHEEGDDAGDAGGADR